MSTYLMQFSFTQQGIETIKDLLPRAEAAKNVIRQAGGEVHAYYAILGGEYDTMFILNAQNDEKVAQMALSIARAGNVRTQTHRLFNEDEIKSIISSLT
jgi:uncharacterized protein with GYD domain